MNRAKKFLPVLAFVSASICAAAPAHAGIIDYDVGAMIDMTSRLSATVTDSLSPDAARVAVHGGDEDGYSLPDFSVVFTDSLYARSDLFHDDAVLLGKQFYGVAPGGPEFALLQANETLPASFSFDFDAHDAANGDLASVPLIGPVPEPSITWLMMGALLALAGLSRGTRGIHESV
jgi:hypothetical protein